MPSHVTPAMLASAQTELGSSNIARMMAFLKDFPIFPPGPPPGSLGSIERAQNPTFKKPGGANSQNAGDNVDYAKVKMMDPVDKVAFIKFVADPLRPGTISFDVKRPRDLTTNASRLGYLPIWWLPWASRRIVKLKINPSNESGANGTASFNPAGIDPLPNPDVFFTAAINGCSVFASGSPREPSVYHGGIDGLMEDPAVSNLSAKQFQSLGGTSEDIWRNLLDGFKPISDGAARANSFKPRKSAGATFGEINRSDYVAERKADGSHYQSEFHGNPVKTTQAALQLESYLKRRRDMSGASVSPWGCVAGIRDSTGNWSFFLLRNATVAYNRLSYDNKFGLIQWGKQSTPSCVSVNLGHLQFFPAGGAAHYRAHNTLQMV